MKHLTLTALTIALTACQGAVSFEEVPQVDERDDRADAPDGREPPVVAAPSLDDPAHLDALAHAHADALDALSPERARVYLATLSLVLVERPLVPDELSALERDGGGAIRPILASWVDEPAFARSARGMVQTLLSASGAREGVDYELPGNLAALVARDRLPASALLTHPECVDADGHPTSCDTGAPYTAGLLTTRAFLAANASRFNLGRASALMRVFACRTYPMERDLQPPLEADWLIPMFRAETPEEQTVAEATNGFGNGFGCYSCHSQFGAHAQLFVKFDTTGIWHAEADGLQDPDGELGRSTGDLLASHMDDPIRSADETSQVFGQTVANLGEAGAVIARSDAFLSCTTRNIIAHGLGLSESSAHHIDDDALLEAVALARRAEASPSLNALALEAFAHPRVVHAVTPAE
jgi:hypothetical protein